MFYDEVMKARDHILERTAIRPRVGIVLGSGLGQVADAMEDAAAIPYGEIPFFPHSNVVGHAARLVLGRIGGTDTACMQGRFHYYEGFSMKELVFPIFVLKSLGSEKLIVTNACGGINEGFTPGDLMLIEDHINLTGLNPLIGENDERFGPRFPDMTEAYDRGLIALAEKVGAEQGIPLQRGVYALFTGPCFETAAEIRALRTLGADAVGMSTVPEVIAANYLGMRVLGVACITNMATGIAKEKHSHERVLAAAEKSGESLGRLVTELVSRL